MANMFVKQMNIMINNFAKKVVEHIETEEEEVTVEMMMELWNKFFQVKGGKGGKGSGVKRGPTGYLLFCKAQREKKPRCLKDLDFIETSKKLGKMWQALQQKRKDEWNAKAKSENEERVAARSSDDEKPKAKRSRGKRAESDEDEVVRKAKTKGKAKGGAKAVDLSLKSCTELKTMCKDRELKGYSSMKKADLIALLSEGEKKTKSRRRRSKTPEEEEEEVVEGSGEEGSGDEFDVGSDDEGSGEEEEEEEGSGEEEEEEEEGSGEEEEEDE